ncbi:MAG: sulfur carrier protein ThiS [Candidatus Omnitrophica bacterium]|nr:sulfur carrier protein ThiS [Candidatus Omnitrophota bacterium]
MKITINGKEQEFAQGKTLQAVIQECLQKTNHVIAEHNGNIVRSPQWAQISVKEGDQVELVTFVGGG